MPKKNTPSNRPVLTAQKLMQAHGLIVPITSFNSHFPESFVILPSEAAVLRLMKHYNIKKAGNTVSGKTYTLSCGGNLGNLIGIAHANGYGAPAFAMLTEELVSAGMRRFIFAGAAGALQKSLCPGQFVVCRKAISEEGISKHYSNHPESSHPSAALTHSFETSLRENGLSFFAGTTWTTDAIYMETREKVLKQAKKQILSVDMEAAALFSVASYHNIDAAAAFCITDSIAGPEWKHCDDKAIIERSSILLGKSAIDALCKIKDPAFKAGDLKLNIPEFIRQIIKKAAGKIAGSIAKRTSGNI